jgi:threonine dehydratase
MTPELKKVLTEAWAPAPGDTEALKAALVRAQERVREVLTPSPLLHSHWLSEETGADVWLKLDCLTPNGSFKVRGALNAIAARLERRQAAGLVDPAGTPVKICAASAGNHAQGVAFAAKRMGAEAHIFLPRRTPLVKRDATERLGAKVYLVGDVLEEAFEAALAFSKENGAEFIHAFNDFDIIAGQAVCLLEVFSQFEALSGKPSSAINDFLCSVGGGGLAAGCGIAMQLFGNGRVQGVEQATFDSGLRSLKAGAQLPIDHPPEPTLADGISVQLIGNATFSLMKDSVDRIFTVSDDEITAAILGLCEREHLVAEGAGAAAVAALLKNAKAYEGRTVVVSVSGGNIDPQLLSRVIARGLGVTGRTLRLTVRMGDRPGQLRTLLQHIADKDANVLEIHHDRTYTQVNVGNVEVDIALETRNFEHQYDIVEYLQEKGFVARTLQREQQSL